MTVANPSSIYFRNVWAFVRHWSQFTMLAEWNGVCCVSSIANRINSIWCSQFEFALDAFDQTVHRFTDIKICTRNCEHKLCICFITICRLNTCETMLHIFFQTVPDNFDPLCSGLHLACDWWICMASTLDNRIVIAAVKKFSKPFM